MAGSWKRTKPFQGGKIRVTKPLECLAEDDTRKNYDVPNSKN